MKYKFTVVVVGFVLVAGSAMGTEPAAKFDPLVPLEKSPLVPKDLKKGDVKLDRELDKFIRDKNAAILLGKTLFWDMQAGSDGKTACASCHFHAGVDTRTRNTLHPGASGADFRGANVDLRPGDFPFHRKFDPAEKTFDISNVAFDTAEVVGSQGVVKKTFVSLVPGSAKEIGNLVPDPIFNVGGVNVRQVTGRNSPTIINAVFNDRQFWDGRANRFFNGVDPFGDTNPDARIWQFKDKKFAQVAILIDNASLASQAVGPPRSDVEMIWAGRPFELLGQKLLPLRPLADQQIAPSDSVLGKMANNGGKGMKPDVTYARLVREAFKDEWWNGGVLPTGSLTQMEANFTLFWGLSILMYESTLVSDETKFDQFRRDKVKFTTLERKGLELFIGAGKCINCHTGPEFTGATIRHIRPKPDENEAIEKMAMEFIPEAFYDNGFYNIGVRPTAEDLGVGGGRTANGRFIPFSFTLRRQLGVFPKNTGKLDVPTGAATAVRGAFKTPTLRNVELTGPYMHNGGMSTLEQVVEFYARGTDFENRDDKDPDVDGIDEVRGNAEAIAALVAFMKTLTDERVRFQRAPFDHPELIVPNGHSGFAGSEAIDNQLVLPATGKDGGAPLKTFEQILRGER